jgi:hypothetical protein
LCVRVEADYRPLLPLQTDRGVERNPVQPRKKLRVSLKRVQRLIRAQERVLNDISGIVGAVNQSQRGIVKPCLVSGYQLAEGVPLAAQTVRDEPAIVVVHDSSTGNGRVAGTRSSPRRGENFARDAMIPRSCRNARGM